MVATTPMKFDLVRYEARVVQGIDPHEREAKRPGGFGRFLSGMGKVFGAAAFPLSILFPPAAIGAAAMYGVGAIGDQTQAAAYQRHMEKLQKEDASYVSFPGLGQDVAGIQPAAYQSADHEVMGILFARNQAMLHQTQKL